MPNTKNSRRRNKASPVRHKVSASGSAHVGTESKDLLVKAQTKTDLTPLEYALLMLLVPGNGLEDKEWSKPSNIAYGLGILEIESNFGTNNGTPGPGPCSGGKACLGPWQEDESFGTEECRMNAICSTQAAYKGWKDRGWGPWDGFEAGAPNHGAKYLTTATHAVAIAQGGFTDLKTTPIDSAVNAVGDAAGGVGNAIGDIVGFVGKLFEPSLWLRIGKAVLGLILLIMGFITLMKVLVGVDVPLSPKAALS